jgi:multiple sugar transport system substrate-binding protein
VTVSGTLLSACAPQVETVVETVVVEEEVPVEETVLVEVEVTAAPPERGPVNLKLALWGSAEYIKAWEEMVSFFEEENEGVTVEIIAVPGVYYDKVQVMLAGKSPLDVLIVEDKMTRFFASNGVIIPLDEYVTVEDTDKYYQATIAPFKWEGRTYGLPRRVNNTACYINQTMFDEAGIDYPEEGWTQDDCLTIAQQLTDTSGGETQVYGADFLYVWNHLVPWVWSNGGEYFAEDFSKALVDMPETVDTFQKIADFTYVHGVTPTPEVRDAMESTAAMFISQRLAMIVGGYGCWLVPTFRKIEDFEWDICPLPQGSQGKTNIVYASCFAVTAHSEYPAEAVQFTLFSTGPRAQAEEAKNPTAIPSIKEVAESEAFIDPTQPPEHMAQLITELEYGRPAADVYHPTKFAETNTIFGEELDFLWRGKRDAAETCAVLRERLDEVLAEA